MGFATPSGGHASPSLVPSPHQKMLHADWPNYQQLPNDMSAPEWNTIWITVPSQRTQITMWPWLAVEPSFLNLEFNILSIPAHCTSYFFLIKPYWFASTRAKSKYRWQEQMSLIRCWGLSKETIYNSLCSIYQSSNMTPRLSGIHVNCNF